MRLDEESRKDYGLENQGYPDETSEGIKIDMRRSGFTDGRGSRRRSGGRLR